MLTPRVPTDDSEFELYVMTLVAQALARRAGGSAIIPVQELMEVAQLEAQWDRSGDSIVIQVGELCQKSEKPAAGASNANGSTSGSDGRF